MPPTLRSAIDFIESNAHLDLTLADIALEVGCSCQSHLTTLFRKHLGTTPGAVRVSARDRGGRVPHFTTTMTGNDRTIIGAD